MAKIRIEHWITHNEHHLEPKTCINYFQKGSYAFNISELWEKNRFTF